MEHSKSDLDGKPIPRIKVIVNECGVIVEAALGAGDWFTVESRGFGKGEQPCYVADTYFAQLDARGIDYYRVRVDTERVQQSAMNLTLK